MSSSTELHTALDALVDRTTTTLAAVDEEFPYVADPQTGKWDTSSDGNWAGGHWIGLLWLAAEHANDRDQRKRLLDAAHRATDTVRSSMPRNTPFCGMTFHYAGFRGYDVTGDRDLFALGLTGADAMVELFSEPSRQIPIGTEETTFQVKTDGTADEFPDPMSESLHGLGAVDTVYLGLPVLWRAYKETGHERFRDVALAHADRHLDWFCRSDGSTWNEAAFDPENGQLERQFNELAYSDDTCWARGLGWHVAGLARAYEETGAERYLSAIERSVEYYQTETPSDLVPYWDFEAPNIPDEPRDTSAAALVAYGLTRLSRSERRVRNLREFGRSVLHSIVDSYLITDPDDKRRGMVQAGTFSMPANYGVDSELIWSDYYVAYALSNLVEKRNSHS